MRGGWFARDDVTGGVGGRDGVRDGEQFHEGSFARLRVRLLVGECLVMSASSSWLCRIYSRGRGEARGSVVGSSAGSDVVGVVIEDVDEPSS